MFFKNLVAEKTIFDLKSDQNLKESKLMQRKQRLIPFAIIKY